MPSGKDLRRALKANDLTMEVAAAMLKISRGTLYNIVDKDELDPEFVQNVQDRLNITLPGAIEATPKNYIVDRRNQKIISKPFLVPLVPYKARAGYLKAYDQIDFIEELEKYAIPPNVDPVGAVWRYFEVGGDSMEPALRSGDLLLCSQVPGEDWLQIRDFYIYVIVTETELLVKRLVLEDDYEHYLLLSENDEQNEPRLLPINTIKQLWVVRRHIKRELPAIKQFDLDAIRKKLNRN